MTNIFYLLLYFQTIDKVNAFEREIANFTLVIDKTLKILKEDGFGRYQPYAPKCYYTYSGPPASVIIMEDLKDSGFRHAEHSAGLDMKHCLLAVNCLATYHAASVVLNARHPDKLKLFKQIQYTEDAKKNVKKLFEPTLRRIAFEAETWPECEGEIAHKFSQLAVHPFEHLVSCLKTGEKDFRVLAHKDVWLKNIMFKYPEGSDTPTDVRQDIYIYFLW